MLKSIHGLQPRRLFEKPPLANECKDWLAFDREIIWNDVRYYVIDGKSQWLYGLDRSLKWFEGSRETKHNIEVL